MISSLAYLPFKAERQLDFKHSSHGSLTVRLDELLCTFSTENRALRAAFVNLPEVAEQNNQFHN